MSRIHVTDLTRKIHRNLILQIKQLDLNDGITGIVGPNGSGKSTLLKIISGSMDDFEGEVAVDGINLRDNHKKCTSIMGSIIENPSIYPYVTPYDVLKLFCRIRIGKGADYNDQVISKLKELDLIHVSNSSERDLSTGERKRLVIGMASIGQPSIVILDEPGDNLDPAGKEILKDIILKLSKDKNRAIVLTTHDLPFASSLCDRVMFLKKGRIVEDVKVENNKYFLSIETDSISREKLLSRFNGAYMRKKDCMIPVGAEYKIESIWEYIKEEGINVNYWEKTGRIEVIYFKIFGE